MNIKIEFDKASMLELQENIKKIPMHLRAEKLRDINLAAAQPMIQAARRNAPVKSGTLRKNIDVIKRLSKGTAIYVGPDHKKAYYGAMVEYGSLNKRTGKNNTPKPYMRPAFEQTKSHMLRIMTKGVEDLIAKIPEAKSY